jgi:RimJ/RimL family protein N-acetyltransferase
VDISRSLSGVVMFETQRLRCRRWLPTDLEALFAVYSDEEGSRWVGDGSPITRSECEAWLRVTAANYEERGYGMFALEVRSSAKVIGFCGLVHPGGQAEAEIKYAFMRSHWGLGLASEAVPALLTYGALAHHLGRIIATVAPENVASQRVLLKSGLSLVDVTEGESGAPTQVYEWHAGRRADTT